MSGSLMRVEVRGLRETRRALRQAGGDMPKMLRGEMNTAAQHIVSDARSRYARIFNSNGRTVNRIRVLSTTSTGRVAFGGKKYPWAHGQEFGSQKYPQFSPWSGPSPGGGRGSAGKFLYPAARAGIREYRHNLIKGTERVLRAASFRTRGFN